MTESQQVIKVLNSTTCVALVINKKFSLTIHFHERGEINTQEVILASEVKRYLGMRLSRTLSGCGAD